MACILFFFQLFIQQTFSNLFYWKGQQRPPKTSPVAVLFFSHFLQSDFFETVACFLILSTIAIWSPFNSFEWMCAWSCLTPCEPMDCSRQASLSMGFSKQEYWSRLPFPTPGDLPKWRREPASLWLLDWQANSLLLVPPGKNWSLRIVMLEKTFDSPLDCKEIQLVHPKGDQSWVFIGRTDAEAEAPVLWPPDAKSLPTHWKRTWCWERLRAGGEGDDRWWLDSITNSMGMNLSKLQEIVKDSEASCAAVQRVRHHLATEQQQNSFEELCWWLSGKCRRNRFDSLVGRSPGKGNGNPLQYSCLENLMERGVWCAAVHRVTKELNTT